MKPGINIIIVESGQEEFGLFWLVDFANDHPHPLDFQHFDVCSFEDGVLSRG